jgi:hypothetical protein
MVIPEIQKMMEIMQHLSNPITNCSNFLIGAVHEWLCPDMSVALNQGNGELLLYPSGCQPANYIKDELCITNQLPSCTDEQFRLSAFVGTVQQLLYYGIDSLDDTIQDILCPTESDDSSNTVVQYVINNFSANITAYIPTLITVFAANITGSVGDNQNNYDLASTMWNDTMPVNVVDIIAA